MSERSKSISLKQLRSAVHAAAAAAGQKHPGVKFKVEEAEIIYRPWWICGIPVPWPIFENGGFTTTFGEALASNPSIGALREGVGDVQVATYSVGGTTIIGVRGGSAGLVE
ncbi:MAG: hypothetical protein WA655_05610 [Candidatus Korobacteraceae bacterium]